jgi:hypothetical protein
MDGDHLVAEDIVGIGHLSRQRGLAGATATHRHDAVAAVVEAAGMEQGAPGAGEEHGPEQPEQRFDRGRRHPAMAGPFEAALRSQLQAGPEVSPVNVHGRRRGADGRRFVLPLQIRVRGCPASQQQPQGKRASDVGRAGQREDGVAAPELSQEGRIGPIQPDVTYHPPDGQQQVGAGALSSDRRHRPHST